MAENERIIELSINEKQFKQQMNSIIGYMSIFEKKIDNFEKKVNSIDLSGKFKNIDKNMSESSKNISKDISLINNNLDGIANTVNGTVLDSLMSLNDKFSFLGITGLKVLNELSDSFIVFTKNIVKSMTEIENMQAAMTKFEQKNNAIRTIMNSITDDKVPEAYKNQIDGTVKTIDYVTDALSKLETFSDETSYDFTQMTQSIGKLVSMGNSLEKASDTVLGMANWSSLVGKSAKDFESLSYAIEKVAGLGYVGLQQYQMLSTYMDPQTKQNILEQATALGTLKKASDGTFKTLNGETVSLQNFSTNLKDKWLTMDVLNGVMAKYSSFSNAVIEYMDETGAIANEAINELESKYDSVSVKAFKSAQEAKTFGEAIQSVQMAVTTGWSKSFELIFGNVEEASKMFTDLANKLYDVFAGGKYLRNELLTIWKGGKDVSKIINDSFNNINKKLKEAGKETKDFSKFNDYIYALSNRMNKFGDSLDEAQKNIENTFEPELVREFNFLLNKTDGLIEDINLNSGNGRQNLINSLLGDNSDYAKYIKKIQKDLNEHKGNLFEIQEQYKNSFDPSIIEKFNEQLKGIDTNNLKEVNFLVNNLVEGLDYGFLDSIIDIVDTIKESFKDVFNLNIDEKDEGAVKEFANIMIEMSKELNNFAKSLKPTEEFLNNLKIIIGTLATIIKGFIGIIVSVTKPVLKIISQLSSYLFELSTMVSTVLYTAIHNISVSFLNLVNTLKSIFAPAIKIVTSMFRELGVYLNIFVASLSGLIDPIKKVFTTINKYLRKMKIEGKFEPVYKLLNNISTFITKWVAKIVRSFQLLMKDGNIQKIIEIFQILYKRLSAIIYKMSLIFKQSKLFKYITNFFNFIKRSFNTFSHYLDTIDFSKSIGKILDKVKNAINLIPTIKIDKNLIKKDKQGKTLNEYFENMVPKDIMKNITVFNDLQKGINKIKQNLKSKGILKTIKDIFTDLISSLKTMNWKNVFKGIFDIVKVAAITLTELLNIALTNLLEFLKSSFTAEKVSETSKKMFNILGNNLKNIALTLGNILKFILSNVLGVLKNISPELVKVAPVLITLILMMKNLNRVADIAQTFADAKLKEAEFHNKLAVILSIVAVAGGIILLSKIPLPQILKAIVVISGMLAIVNILPRLIDKWMPVAKKGGSITAASVGGLLIMVLAFTTLLNGIKSLSDKIKTNPIPVLLSLAGILTTIAFLGALMQSIPKKIKGESTANITLDLNNFFKDIGTVLTTITALIKLVNIKSILKSLGVLIIAMVSIASAITLVNILMSKISSSLNSSTLAEANKGGGIVSAIFGSINAASLTKSLIAIQSLTNVIKDLSSIPIVTLVVSIGTLVLAIAAVSYFSKPLTEVTDSVLKISAAILIFAVSVSLISSNVLPLIAILISFIATFGILMILAGTFKKIFDAVVLALQLLGETFLSISAMITSFGVAALLVASAIKIIVGTFSEMDKMSLSLFGKMLLLAAGIGAISLALVPLAIALKPVVDSLINLLKVMASFVGKKIEGFIDGKKVKDETTSASNDIDSLKKSMTEGEKEAKTFKDTMKDGLDGVKEGAKESKNNILDLFGNVTKSFNGIKGSFGGIKDLFGKMGENTSEGFMGGISSLKDKFKGFFSKNVGDAAADDLEIRSPSRLFRRFGVFVDKGFIEGVLEKKPLLQQVMKDTLEFDGEFYTMNGKKYSAEAMDEYIKNIDNINKQIEEQNKKIEENFKIEQNRKLIDAYVSEFLKLNQLGYMDLNNEQISKLSEADQKRLEHVKQFMQGLETNNSTDLSMLGFNEEEIDLAIKYRDEILKDMDAGKNNPFVGLIDMMQPIFTVIDSIKNGFSNLMIGIQTFGNNFMLFIDSIKEPLLRIGNLLYQFFIWPIIESFKTLGSIFINLGKTILEFGVFIASPFLMIKNLIGLITSLGGATTAAGASASAASTGGFAAFLAKLKLIWSGITGFVSAIGAAIAAVVNFVVNLVILGVVINTVMIVLKAINFVIAAVRLYFATMIKLTSMLWSAIAKFISGTAGKIINFFKSLLPPKSDEPSIFDWIGEKIGAFVEFVKSLKILEFFEGIVNGIKWIANKIDEGTNALNNKSDELIYGDTKKQQDLINSRLGDAYDINEERKKILTEQGAEAAQTFLKGQISKLTDDTELQNSILEKYNAIQIKNPDMNFDEAIRTAYTSAKEEYDEQTKKYKSYTDKTNETYKQLYKKYGEEVANNYIKAEIARFTNNKDEQNAIYNQFKENDNKYGGLLDEFYKKYLSEHKDVVDEGIKIMKDEFSSDTYKEIKQSAGEFGEQVADAYLLAEAAKITNDPALQQAILKKYKGSLNSEKTELEKILEEHQKEQKEAHESYLKTYKDQIKSEKNMVKYYAEQEKKIDKQKVKDKASGLSQILIDQKDYTASAQSNMTTWLDNLANSYEAADESFNDYLQNLDENISAEDKANARRMEALKKWNEEWKRNSGFSWDASGKEKFKQEKTELKSTDILKNQNSQLQGYKNFVADIEKLAGTNVSDEFIRAVWEGGPSSDIYKNAISLSDKELESFAANYDFILGVQKKDSEVLERIIHNRELYKSAKKAGTTYNPESNAIEINQPTIQFKYKKSEIKESFKNAGADDSELDSLFEEYKERTNELKEEGIKVGEARSQAYKEIIDKINKENNVGEYSEDDELFSTGTIIQDNQSNTEDAYTGAYNQVTAIGEGIQAALPTLQQSTQLLNQNMAQLSATQNQETGSNQNTEMLTQVGELQNKMSTAEAAIQQIINSILQTVQGLINTDSGSVFEQEGLQVNQGLANGIIKNIGVVTDSVIQMCNAAIQAARENLGIASPSTVFYKLGEYIIQGLCNAITDGQSAVTSAMVDEVLASLESESEKSEGIASPSKKWYKFGSFIDQGLANGISENVQAPMSALGSLISDISENMEMDEEYNPVITPVIDLSEAKKQSKGINTLFANNQAMQISADLQANRLSQNEGKNSENNNGVKTITFTQNNYSPKELSRLEIYRQTNNQFSQLKTLLDK